MSPPALHGYFGVYKRSELAIIGMLRDQRSATGAVLTQLTLGFLSEGTFSVIRKGRNWSEKPTSSGG